MSFFSRLFKGAKSGEENTYLPQGSYLNPYSTLGELDFHLIAEGRHERLWDSPPHTDTAPRKAVDLSKLRAALQASGARPIFGKS